MCSVFTTPGQNSAAFAASLRNSVSGTASCAKPQARQIAILGTTKTGTSSVVLRWTTISAVNLPKFLEPHDVQRTRVT